MITDYKHYGNRRRPIPWASIIKFIVIVAVLLWMGGAGPTACQGQPRTG